MSTKPYVRPQVYRRHADQSSANARPSQRTGPASERRALAPDLGASAGIRGLVVPRTSAVQRLSNTVGYRTVPINDLRVRAPRTEGHQQSLRGPVEGTTAIPSKGRTGNTSDNQIPLGPPFSASEANGPGTTTSTRTPQGSSTKQLDSVSLPLHKPIGDCYA